MMIIIAGGVVAVISIVLCIVIIVICVHKKRVKKRSVTLSKDICFGDINVTSGSDGMYQVEPYSSVACYGNNGLYSSVEIKYLSTFKGKSETPKHDNTIKFQEESALSSEEEMVSNVVYESYDGVGNTTSTLENEDTYLKGIDSTYQTIEPPPVTDGVYDRVQYTSDEGFEDNIIYESYNQSES